MKHTCKFLSANRELDVSPKKTKSALNPQNDYISHSSSETESSDPDTYNSPLKKVVKNLPKKRGPKTKKNKFSN